MGTADPSLRRRGPRGWSLLLLALATAFIIASSPARAQTVSAGAIHGTVVDPAGARVPRARLVLASAAGVAATAESDAAGRFSFGRLPAGRYELRVGADGFRSDALEVGVVSSADLEVDVQLHVSAVTESVVVSAAQVELPLERAADSVTIMTSRDLQARQAETVSDALRSVGGIAVARNGGRGGVTSLFPRGGDSDFTLVLVDGIKANAFGGGFDFAELPAAGLERVEVVRGPQSALFGADAIGGVVQIVTRGGGRPRGDASVEAGSFGTRRFTGGTSGSHGAWSWGAAAEHLASDGFTGRAPATGEPVSNDDFSQAHASGSAAWRAPSGADLRATLNVTSSERGVPGPYGSNPIGAYTGVDRISRGTTATRQFGARWLQPLTGRLRQTISVSYFDLDRDYTSQYPGSDGSPVTSLSKSGSTRLAARAQADWQLSPVAAFSGGVEAQRERATSTFITGGAGSPVPIRRTVLGAFGELRLQPTGRLSVTAGVRAERIRRDRLDESLDPYSPRPAFGIDVAASVNPRVSAAYFLPGGRTGPIGWTRVHAAAGTGMRAPDALEIAFTDNPGLRPERNRSVEAGIDQALLGERLVVGATAFANRYQDLIVAVGPALQDASRFRTDNVANARSRGIELFAALRPSSGLEVRASYTFLSTAVLAVDRAGVAPAPFDVGDPLLRRPRHAGSLDATWTRGSLTAFWRMGARGRTRDVEPSWGTYGGLFDNPGFLVFDAGLTLRVSRLMDVFGRVGNLLDRRYEETFGYPALSRHAMLGVRLAAGT